ncbi:MAG TPA: winged helix-turn-helix domain-containing protein [Candidatus Acidoferrales bacterium]|nr:winged helix-turn-helix domain-containing protein [Candidatus Acidoferrales bacterium]
MTADAFRAFSFDDVLVRPQTSEVFKAGAPVPLEPKAFALLVFLIENRRRLVEKDEILDIVWKDAVVTENALASAIAKLRKTLGDDTKTAKYIQTIHTRGYRFIADVLEREDSGVNVRARIPGGNGAPALQDAVSGATTQEAARTVPGARRIASRKPLAFAVVLCGLLVAGGFLWKRSSEVRRGTSKAIVASIAVLPFQLEGTNAGNEYLGIEIADALTARLSNSTRLDVRPTAVVMHYATPGNAPADIGRALGVDYLLLGKIHTSPDRVTTELIRIRDGAPLQTATFDDTFTSIFQVEESLSSKILRAMTVTLDHEERQQFRKRYTENPEAYDAFLKAHYFMNQASAEGTEKGIASFQHAIELDPRYAMAYAGLADCYLRIIRFVGAAPAEFVPKSRAAATKALEIDETVAYAHSMLGYIAYQFDWDYPRAEREYQRGRELDPTLTHQWHASYLLALNRVPEAEKEYVAFAQFLPFMLPGGASFGQYFYLSRQHDKAVDQLHKTIEMGSRFAPAHELLGMVYEQQGRMNEAAAELQKAVDLSSGNYGMGSMGHLYASLGKPKDARRMLRLLERQSKHAYVSPYHSALIYAGLGEKDKAIDALQKAYDERSLYAPYLRFDPRLNDLRGEPRFQDFLRSTGLPF